jgi:hypothetical protein
VALRPLITLTFLIILSACSETPEDPEMVLRGVIAEAEQTIEERDLFAAMAFVDQNYTDDRGNGWAQLRAQLAGYFLRHPSITIISKIDQVRLVDETQAELLLYAGLAGSATEASTPLAGWRGNLLRFELRFQLNEEDEWLLIHSAWRQARREDFIQ